MAIAKKAVSGEVAPVKADKAFTLKKVAPGIYERFDKDGNSAGQFQAKVREGGVNQSKTFKSKKEAQAWQAEKRTAINRGEPVNIEKIKKLTLGEILTEFQTNNTLKKDKSGRIRRLIKEIGAVPLSNFKTATFEKYIKAKLTQEIPSQPKTKKSHPLFNAYKTVVDGVEIPRIYKPSTVRKYYYDIKEALEAHAKTHDYHFDSKPFDDVPAPPSWEEPRERRLNDGELDRVLSACDDMYVNQVALKCIIRFQTYSCMRIGETLLMNWKDVHLNTARPEESYIFVPKKNQKIKHKAGAKDRIVLMQPDLYALFDEIKKMPPPSHKKKVNPKMKERVFPHWSSSATFGSRFKVITKNAGSTDLHPHDLRHEAISWFFENTNLTDIEISEISGHIELDTLKRYANLRPQKTGAKLWASVGALNNHPANPDRQVA